MPACKSLFYKQASGGPEVKRRKDHMKDMVKDS